MGKNERERVEEPVMEVSKSLQSTWPSHMESMRLIPQLLKIMYKYNTKTQILLKFKRKKKNRIKAV
jgi:hypothetical protein